ncbi:unannotated protein [freshwater metagenome]|uniref:Unannotated protein n=1 Tax=freshwater metagenome TaxID=449393 RepID=A0A6J7Q8J8_9ZZZZ
MRAMVLDLASMQVADDAEAQEHSLEREAHSTALGPIVRTASIGPPIRTEVQPEEALNLMSGRVDNSVGNRLVGGKPDRAERRQQRCELRSSEPKLDDAPIRPAARVWVAEVRLERTAERIE